MSNLRIALVAEGSVTEPAVIQAALVAILAPRTFVLTQLQPESTAPRFGGGWGGVLKWCQHASQRHAGPLSQDPTLAGFDAIVLHLDADVASHSYDQLGPSRQAEVAKNNWGALPCSNPCPPCAVAKSDLFAVLKTWLRPVTVDAATVVCIPAMNTGAWMAAANLPTGHHLLVDLECSAGIEQSLGSLPLKDRIRKSRADTLARAPYVTHNWAQVRERCTRANAFEMDIKTAIP